MTDPFHLIASTSDAPLFLFGDHASRHIPERYDNLGLSGEDLTRHIAWDIGSEDVLRGLCARFGCGGMVAGFSRLLIDPNRSKRMDTLVPEDSDGTRIPGNQNLSAEGRKERIDTLYNPYHAALSAQLNKAEASSLICLLYTSPSPRDRG